MRIQLASLLEKLPVGKLFIEALFDKHRSETGIEHNMHYTLVIPFVIRPCCARIIQYGNGKCVNCWTTESRAVFLVSQCKQKLVLAPDGFNPIESCIGKSSTVFGLHTRAYAA